MNTRHLIAVVSGLTAATIGFAFAQDDRQIRCMQLEQELAGVRSGGGGGGYQPGLDRSLAEAKRVYNGTRAAMEDAGCFERFFIFGGGLVRNPKCLKMNARAEDARRQVEQLQGQRQAGGAGSRRRQADLMAALSRNGCGNQYREARREPSEGGLFSWFGRGGRDEEHVRPEQPVYRSIDPGGRYRSVCVRMCDGFFFPISYSTYSSRLSEDASMCQSNCAAPAELFVYHNPGGDISQAISLNGAPYASLPNAFRYRKEYVKGCSCKEAEYNPTEIEAAGKKAEGAAPPAKTAAAPAKAPAPAPEQPPANLDLDLSDTTGASESPPPKAEAAPAPEEAAPASEEPATAAQPAEPAEAAPAEPAAEPMPEDEAPGQQSTVTKSRSRQ